MKAYAIVLQDNEVSKRGFTALQESSEAVGNKFDIEIFDAITSDIVKEDMENEKLIWKWPDSLMLEYGQLKDSSGLRKHDYGSSHPLRRRACAMSHFHLWKKAMNEDEAILILEHDAVFVEKLKSKSILKSRYDVIGLNDPRGATRMAGTFHAIVQKEKRRFLPCPIIDRMEVPQGIAGASAYIIKPKGAKNVIKACYEYGLWPNDAILCQQLVPKIGVTKKYYTKVQGLPSTTTTNA